VGADRLSKLSIRKLIKDIVNHPAIVEPASYLFRRRPTGIDQETWNREYAAGYWNYLGGLNEMSRFAVIAGYCRTIVSATSLLDIGCGNGNLSAWVCQDKDLRYVGIDIADVAIQQACERGQSQARFEVADAATFDPGGRFDVIVFNEMLFYLPKPELVLARYESFLAPDGVFIISMWRATESLRTWRRCASRLKVLDHVRLRASSTIEWDIRLCRPGKPL
jgi:2-polyprenyl-3-methyl-5-hydroxy-6-metoxy-1,4-benzoquinol methylase